MNPTRTPKNGETSSSSSSDSDDAAAKIDLLSKIQEEDHENDPDAICDPRLPHDLEDEHHDLLRPVEPENPAPGGRRGSVRNRFKAVKALIGMKSKHFFERVVRLKKII